MLILDTERYRYQKYISDIAGQDVAEHKGIPLRAIVVVRNWLQTASGIELPSGYATYERYERFRADLPLICDESKFDINDLLFGDLCTAIHSWIRRAS